MFDKYKFESYNVLNKRAERWGVSSRRQNCVAKK